MQSNNDNGKYQSAIYTTQDNLKSLEKILNVQSLSSYKKSNILQNDTDVYGKIPSHDEIMRMNNQNNIPDSDMPNLDSSLPPNNNNDVPPTTDNNPSTPRTRQRVFPMQGSILSNITKSP